MTLREVRGKKDKGLVPGRLLLDKAGIANALQNIAAQVLERNSDPKRLLLLGIRTGGVYLAQRLHALIEGRARLEVLLGTMDITLYRDDVFTGLPRPEVGPTELPGSLEGKAVILIDDVLFTGRTIRAALEELVDFGRPDKVELAVLVDRGHRELPIQPDYVGLRTETTRAQTVRVDLSELGEPDQVLLCEKAP